MRFIANSSKQLCRKAEYVFEERPGERVKGTHVCREAVPLTREGRSPFDDSQYGQRQFAVGASLPGEARGLDIITGTSDTGS